jgi:hypothetical protein
MFLLYAIVGGLVVGRLSGGRFSALANLDFRWPYLAILGLIVQIVLFSDVVAQRVGSAGPPVYVASTALVFIAVLRNIRIPGLWIVALGAASNLAAILANGGYMPTTLDAREAIGKGAIGGTYTNSALIEHPNLQPLTDIFSLPDWLPATNVFSIGDVLIALGVAVTIVLVMRGGRPDRAGDTVGSAAPGDARPSPAGGADRNLPQPTRGD